MGKDSKIEWTTHTFNPWVSCTKVSEGCKNCYAETMEARWGRPWGKDAPRRVTSDAYWSQPFKWDRAASKAGERHRVFCASFADVFEDHPDLVAPRARLKALIKATPNLDWLLLTKRPENMVRMTEGWVGFNGTWPDNVWAGTSVENQARANQRIPELLKVPAKVLFLSCEPLLEEVDLTRIECNPEKPHLMCSALTEDHDDRFYRAPNHINWVIVGGESGRGARPMNPEWARGLRNQCKEAGAAFFMKQMGGSGDKGGDLESIPEDLRIREFPQTQGE